MSDLLKRLRANVCDIAAWTEALEQLADQDSPEAIEIRGHIDALSKQEANAIEIAAWTEALGQTTDWNSPAAVAIRKQILVLVTDHLRLMGLPENEVAKINIETGALGDKAAWQSLTKAWRVIGAALPREKVSDFKHHIDELRHRWRRVT